MVIQHRLLGWQCYCQSMDKQPKKLPRLPNKVKGISGQPKKDYTPEEIEMIKNTGAQHDASIAAKLVELGGDAERYLHVLRLKMRGLSRGEIAAALGFSVSTIEKDITAINKQLRAEVQNFDYQLFIGQSMAFYEEVRNATMVIAADSDNAAVVRLGALKVALNAEVDKISLLEKIGAFDETNLALNPESPHGSEEQSDAEDFRQFMKAVIGTNSGDTCSDSAD